MGKIEIYIRRNSEGAMLNFYIPKEMRPIFVEAAKNGHLDMSASPANFELVIDGGQHVVVSLNQINFSDMDD